jgi:hypothetical protein
MAQGFCEVGHLWMTPRILEHLPGQVVLPIEGHLVPQRRLARAWIRDNVASQRNPLLHGRLEALLVPRHFLFRYGQPKGGLVMRRRQMMTDCCVMDGIERALVCCDVCPDVCPDVRSDVGTADERIPRLPQRGRHSGSHARRGRHAASG